MVTGLAVSSYRGDYASRRIHATDAIVLELGDKQISLCIYRQSGRVTEQRFERKYVEELDLAVSRRSRCDRGKRIDSSCMDRVSKRDVRR